MLPAGPLAKVPDGLTGRSKTITNVKVKGERINLQQVIPRSEIATYIDTVELFFRSIPIGLRKSVENIIRKRLLIKACKGRRGKIWGYRLVLNRPSYELLRFFAGLQLTHWCCVSRVDLAVDFITETQGHADVVALFIRQHLVLRHRRKDLLKKVESTVYWNSKSRAKNPVLYADKPARTIEGRPPCAHFELRILRARAIKRAGIVSIDSLIALDVAAAINRYVYLLPSFDADRFASAIIRRSLAAERRRFLLRRRTRYSPFTDRYRAVMRHRFACYLRRYDLDTAQGFKDAYPRAARKMERAPVITIYSTPHFTNSSMTPIDHSAQVELE
jgi:hypothetical protein